MQYLFSIPILIFGTLPFLDLQTCIPPTLISFPSFHPPRSLPCITPTERERSSRQKQKRIGTGFFPGAPSLLPPPYDRAAAAVVRPTKRKTRNSLPFFGFSSLSESGGEGRVSVVCLSVREALVLQFSASDACVVSNSSCSLEYLRDFPAHQVLLNIVTKKFQ